MIKLHPYSHIFNNKFETLILLLNHELSEGKLICLIIIRGCQLRNLLYFYKDKLESSFPWDLSLFDKWVYLICLILLIEDSNNRV